MNKPRNWILPTIIVVCWIVGSVISGYIWLDWGTRHSQNAYEIGRGVGRDEGFQLAVEAYYRNKQDGIWKWHGVGRRYDPDWVKFMQGYCDLIEADAPPPIMPYLDTPPDSALSYPVMISETITASSPMFDSLSWRCGRCGTWVREDNEHKRRFDSILKAAYQWSLPEVTDE